MLSDKEKEAIEIIKYFKKMKWYSQPFDNGTEILSEEEKQDIDIVLNLIEKQSKEIERINEILIWKQKHEEQLQKEIEELKEVKWYYEISRVPKDKIKAKIEEVKDGTYDAKIVLQSLLEKEN